MLRPCPPARDRRGFTLIELMVTISLFAILVTLSLPSFVTWIRNAQVRSVADSLAAGLRTAQAESVRRNRQVVMAFTNDPPATGANPYASATAVAGGKKWWLQTVPQSGETTADVAYITSGAIVDGASNVAVAGDPNTTRSLCFDSNGRLTTNSSITGLPSGTCTKAKTTFLVSQAGSDRPLKVILQIGGQIRMCDPNRPALSASAPDGCPP